MPKLVCVECERDYKVVVTGNYVIEMFCNPPEPYKILSGDRWECPGCGHQIIAGFGSTPLAEHFQDKFSNSLNKAFDSKDTIYCYER